MLYLPPLIKRTCIWFIRFNSVKTVDSEMAHKSVVKVKNIMNIMNYKSAISSKIILII